MIERYCDICGKKMEPGHIRFEVMARWNGPKDIFCDISEEFRLEDVCRTCVDDIIKDISDLSVRKKNVRKKGYNGLEEVEEDVGNQLREDIRQSRAGGRNNS